MLKQSCGVTIIYWGIMKNLKTLYRMFLAFRWNASTRLKFGVYRLAWPKKFSVLGPLGLSVNGSGKIQIGHNVRVVNSNQFNRAGINHPTQLVVCDQAQLIIGDHVGISGAAIFSAESIVIGNHVLIGANASIYDTDFHPIDAESRRLNKPAKTSPIVIEDDVWIGASATILKGVRIGNGSVIAAGSIVTRDIPPNVLAAGVPARVIRVLMHEDKPCVSNNLSSSDSIG